MKHEKMLIEDIYCNGVDTLIPNNIPQFIQSTEWWSIFTEYFDELLLQLKGGYALNLPRVKDYSDISNVVANIGTIIRLHLVSHFYEYNGLYGSTQLEYNPIWNVDGLVKTEGKRNSENTSSSERNINDDVKKTGSDTLTHSGEDVNTKSGTDTLTSDGSDALNSSSIVGETPMDSTSFIDKERTSKEDNTTYARTDTTNYGSVDTFKYGGKDVTEFNNSISDISKETFDNEGATDENYEELVTRQGNIGITSTQSLILEERAIVNFSWLEYVVNDISSRFIEGVIFAI